MGEPLGAAGGEGAVGLETGRCDPGFSSRMAGRRDSAMP